MHPYLRFAGVVAGSFVGPRLGPFEASRLSMRVLPVDVEVSRMNNGRYVTLMDLGRFDLAFRTGLATTLAKNRWFPLVGSLSMRYRRSLRLGQRYDLVTRIVAWDEKWWFMEQRFEAGGELAAKGWVKALFRGPRGNVAPAEMLAAMNHADTPSPPLPEGMKLWLASEEAMRGED